jgi:hypothetical protein
MCRSIKVLFNFDPPANDEEIRSASLQFVRKLSGNSKPSRENAAAFEKAVSDISISVEALLGSLKTTAHPKNREIEASKAKLKAQKRFQN